MLALHHPLGPRSTKYCKRAGSLLASHPERVQARGLARENKMLERYPSVPTTTIPGHRRGVFLFLSAQRAAALNNIYQYNLPGTSDSPAKRHADTFRFAPYPLKPLPFADSSGKRCARSPRCSTAEVARSERGIVPRQHRPLGASGWVGTPQN